MSKHTENISTFEALETSIINGDSNAFGSIIATESFEEDFFRQKNKDGHTLLTLALMQETVNPFIVKNLLIYGAEIGSQEKALLSDEKLESNQKVQEAVAIGSGQALTPIENLKNAVKGNNVRMLDRILSGDIGASIDLGDSANDMLLTQALSHRHPNPAIIEKLVGHGAVINEKSQELLGELTNNTRKGLSQEAGKAILKAVENGKEKNTLRELGKAFICADKEKAEPLIKTIKARGYNINLPVVIFDIERPVVHAVAKNTNLHEYSTSQFKNNKDWIAKEIVSIEGFNPNVVAVAEGQSPQHVTKLAGKFENENKKLYNPDKMLKEWKADIKDEVVFDTKTKTLKPCISDTEKSTTHKESKEYKEAAEVVNDAIMVVQIDKILEYMASKKASIDQKKMFVASIPVVLNKTLDISFDPTEQNITYSQETSRTIVSAIKKEFPDEKKPIDAFSTLLKNNMGADSIGLKKSCKIDQQPTALIEEVAARFKFARDNDGPISKQDMTAILTGKPKEWKFYSQDLKDSNSYNKSIKTSNFTPVISVSTSVFTGEQIKFGNIEDFRTLAVKFTGNMINEINGLEQQRDKQQKTEEAQSKRHTISTSAVQPEKEKYMGSGIRAVSEGQLTAIQRSDSSELAGKIQRSASQDNDTIKKPESGKSSRRSSQDKAENTSRPSSQEMTPDPHSPKAPAGQEEQPEKTASTPNKGSNRNPELNIAYSELPPLPNTPVNRLRQESNPAIVRRSVSELRRRTNSMVTPPSLNFNSAKNEENLDPTEMPRPDKVTSSSAPSSPVKSGSVPNLNLHSHMTGSSLDAETVPETPRPGQFNSASVPTSPTRYDATPRPANTNQQEAEIEQDTSRPLTPQKCQPESKVQSQIQSDRQQEETIQDMVRKLAEMQGVDLSALGKVQDVNASELGSAKPTAGLGKSQHIKSTSM